MRGIILRLTDQNGIFHRIYILAPSKSPNSQHGLFPLIYDSLLSKGASPRSVWNAICSRHLMIFDSLVFKLIGSGSCFISLLLRMLSKVLGAPNLPDRTCRNIERHVRRCQALSGSVRLVWPPHVGITTILRLAVRCHFSIWASSISPSCGLKKLPC